jgi:hypothetical protein
MLNLSVYIKEPLTLFYFLNSSGFCALLAKPTDFSALDIGELVLSLMAEQDNDRMN